jgi:hypothetical protein
MCKWTDGFSGPKMFNCLWAYKRKSVGKMMLKRKEMPIQAFSAKLKKAKKCHAMSSPSSVGTPMMFLD